MSRCWWLAALVVVLTSRAGTVASSQLRAPEKDAEAARAWLDEHTAERRSVAAVIQELATAHRVLGFGERHMGTSSHVMDAVIRSHPFPSETVFAVEIDRALQPTVDEFLSNPRSVSANAVLSKHVVVALWQELMLTAHHCGMRVVCMDADQRLPEEQQYLRDNSMFATIASFVRAPSTTRVLFLAGMHHVQRIAPSKKHPNAAALLSKAFGKQLAVILINPLKFPHEYDPKTLEGQLAVHLDGLPAFALHPLPQPLRGATFAGGKKTFGDNFDGLLWSGGAPSISIGQRREARILQKTCQWSYTFRRAAEAPSERRERTDAEIKCSKVLRGVLQGTCVRPTAPCPNGVKFSPETYKKEDKGHCPKGEQTSCCVNLQNNPQTTTELAGRSSLTFGADLAFADGNKPLTQSVFSCLRNAGIEFLILKTWNDGAAEKFREFMLDSVPAARAAGFKNIDMYIEFDWSVAAQKPARLEERWTAFAAKAGLGSTFNGRVWLNVERSVYGKATGNEALKKKNRAALLAQVDTIQRLYPSAQCGGLDSCVGLYIADPDAQWWSHYGQSPEWANELKSRKLPVWIAQYDGKPFSWHSSFIVVAEKRGSMWVKKKIVAPWSDYSIKQFLGSNSHKRPLGCLPSTTSMDLNVVAGPWPPGSAFASDDVLEKAE